MSAVQFIQAGDRFVAATEIVCITRLPSGGFNVEFRQGIPPAHVADLMGLGEIRTAAKGAQGYCNGELRGIYAWRVCPITSVAAPIWGLRDVKPIITHTIR